MTDMFKKAGEHFVKPMKIDPSDLQKNSEEKEIARVLADLDRKINKGKSENYLVSAIVSTYNSERFIRGCLEDLEAQTIADKLEIIVVNSGSEQNEEAIVKEFQKKYSNIKYIKTEQRETVYAAWNRGIKAASGKYITNANTDDRHRKDALEIMARALDQNPEICLVYGDTSNTCTENETFERHTSIGAFRWPDYSRKLLLNWGCLAGPHPMWRRSVHEEYGYFDESFESAGDYEFWLRISQTNDFLHIPETLGLFFYSPTAAGQRDPELTASEKKRIVTMYRQAAKEGRIIRRKTNHYGKICKEKDMNGNIGKIYFYCPDHKTPSGGIKTLYHHASILNNAGYQAFILHLNEGFNLNWHQYDVPVKYIATGVLIEENDVLVIPEAQPDLMEQTCYLPCTRVVFAMSWLHIYPNLQAYVNWRDFGITCVITPSRTIKEFIEWSMGIPTYLLDISINSSLYYYSGDKVLQVAYLTKKDRSSLLVEKILKAKHAEFRDIEWVGMRNLAEELYAQKLRRSEIFLTTSTQEGIHISCLEAMASGCIVVGYSGVGGREYMVSEGEKRNCVLAENDDYLTLAKRLEKVIFDIRNKDREIDILRQNALQMTSMLSEEREEESVLAFWRNLSRGIRKTGRKKPTLLHERGESNHELWPRTEAAVPGGEGFCSSKSYKKGTAIKRRNKNRFDCSIIIPVFNRVDYTKQCLEALVENTGGVEYEVIIVDNGSADGTGDFLKLLEGDVKIIRNNRNLGFAVACNQGAKAASGRYLTFLNNDTIPQKGWLSAMIKITEAEPNVGIVGSKLVYPETGKIQHAGIVISKRKKNPYNLYQNFPTDHPAVNRTRDFNAVTGACLLIRSDLFFEVGMFDESYINCFEDVDLCLKVREMGLRVVYNPQSFLYHYEAASEGRKDGAEHSTKVFLEKWGDKIEADEDRYYQEDGFYIEYYSDRDARVLPLKSEN
ncbi:MAG: glycosyltransferase [Deltaproteobacteria bacterium]|nr:glycosyltransferase [Deltaproteobacteria bacterium]MBW2073140.1 glycosyltransferase [Deltaproteobacteria bacterium]